MITVPVRFRCASSCSPPPCEDDEFHEEGGPAVVGAVVVRCDGLDGDGLGGPGRSSENED